nr:isopentenyl-diphosphate delta-isomerase i (IDI1) [Polytomella parva]|eukprot:CAMPEP_0175084876 /NCGR_PEP_ID=MMETSP0052_2-20121109/28323_1 /TAXON_ID=51329 ORGANISM="Polytomella parva, Strain SAG 63-3" /NCGR_SAMPLE_ID=MMETSP0052_2 /ASSEMBLY_ACC=CAM_ASM_000194 /LENGTH=288 /DNA_ID=CAMNT_0016356769 /DNA_START=176 /DNA_END=1042 /DNA_ORIENTATION=+
MIRFSALIGRRDMVNGVATRSCLVATRPKPTCNMSTWSGKGCTQEDFMLKDMCLVVDLDDQIVGHSNKHEVHTFDNGARRQGTLHRAFSVFLFDSQNRLLLQQRAADKITFPSVWTNTCCSHPLFGQKPSEVDEPFQIADGSVPGVKAAAVRKLHHELGMDPSQLASLDFKFLTRLRYCARDEDTWGVDAPWGEHEVDYILFARLPGSGFGPKGESVFLDPNPEEIQALKFVTGDELKSMMRPETGLKWSPWFRIIAEKFLGNWWAEIDDVMYQEKHRDFNTIHHILS